MGSLVLCPRGSLGYCHLGLFCCSGTFPVLPFNPHRDSTGRLSSALILGGRGCRGGRGSVGTQVFSVDPVSAEVAACWGSPALAGVGPRPDPWQQRTPAQTLRGVRSVGTARKRSRLLPWGVRACWQTLTWDGPIGQPPGKVGLPPALLPSPPSPRSPCQSGPFPHIACLLKNLSLDSYPPPPLLLLCFRNPRK